jgi:hypothetical protein
MELDSYNRDNDCQPIVVSNKECVLCAAQKEFFVYRGYNKSFSFSSNQYFRKSNHASNE